MINREKSRKEQACLKVHYESLKAQRDYLTGMLNEQCGPTVLGEATIH